jgi:hypothetical protein
MLNTHPIIELIHKYHEYVDIVNNQNIFEYIMDRYPGIAKSEIQYYIGKYDFLKSNDFFGKFATNQVLSGKVTAQIIESQISNFDFFIRHIWKNFFMYVCSTIHKETNGIYIETTNRSPTFDTFRYQKEQF